MLTPKQTKMLTVQVYGDIVHNWPDLIDDPDELEEQIERRIKATARTLDAMERRKIPLYQAAVRLAAFNGLYGDLLVERMEM